MSKIVFDKMQASGNDFIVVDSCALSVLRKPYAISLGVLAKRLCDRKFGVGADGLLLLEKSKCADIRMRIFNADGSEAQMCGNGARCSALWLSQRNKKNKIILETKAGLIEAQISKDQKVKIRLTEPKDIRLDMSIRVSGRIMRVNFINTGVPHAVIFCEGLEKIKVEDVAPQIRYHRKFQPEGTNVNFVEPLNYREIKLRTYERGVEQETLACGTGSVASALVFALKAKQDSPIRVHTQGKEILSVYFKKEGLFFQEVWLEGGADFVFRGWLDLSLVKSKKGR